MIVLIDNYDSFTFNLHQLILNMGRECIVVRNDEITLPELISIAPTHLLISPGPGRPENSGIIIEAIKYFAGKIPVLGVCLGHQAIAQAFGGRVTHAVAPFHGKCSPIKHSQSGVFKGVPQDTIVARYHSLIVDKNNLPADFEITSTTEDGTIMSIEHKREQIVGLQFHPESFATACGELMMKNFLGFAS